MRQDEIWDVDAAQRYDTPGIGMFAPRWWIRRSTASPHWRRRPSARARDRNWSRAVRPSDPARRTRHRHRAVPPDGRPAPHQGRRGQHPGGRGRHGHRPCAGRVHAGLPRVQHDLQPADPGRAGRVLPERGASPHTWWPLRHRALVPELRRLPPGQQATVGRSEPGYILLDTYDVPPTRRLASFPLR